CDDENPFSLFLASYVPASLFFCENQRISGLIEVMLYFPFYYLCIYYCNFSVGVSLTRRCDDGRQEKA
ncbi:MULTISPECIES: hypothetical protein, partial [Priestia]